MKFWVLLGVTYNEFINSWMKIWISNITTEEFEYIDLVTLRRSWKMTVNGGLVNELSDIEEDSN